ncbi:hypothetical protein TUBRATIS_20020 [Tubulinosema ratisbonensis]|uniref:Uncharacterized protein n=1 Tax=Tubulinosema ratisbonensis TaxID=291195 RepID=A0A437AKH1_9MICR|nr:hypothetical protein TUBRATIS_20020 [Tubulinosema ratisbonensis]
MPKKQPTSSIRTKLYLVFVGHLNTYRRLKKSFGLVQVTIFKIPAKTNDFRSVTKKIKFTNRKESLELKLGMLQHGNEIGGILYTHGTFIKITKLNFGHFLIFMILNRFLIKFCLLYRLQIAIRIYNI